MEVECSSFPNRRHHLRRPTPGRGRLKDFSFTIHGIAFALALVASIANGKNAAHLQNRQAVPEPLPPVFADDSISPGSVMPETLLSFDQQREPFSQSPSDRPRNRATEIVQRRDDYAVRRYRQGFFQRLRVSGGWIDSAAHQDLEIGNIETSLTVAVPLGRFENLLIVTSGFGVDALNSSASVNVLSSLYHVGVDFMWRK